MKLTGVIKNTSLLKIIFIGSFFIVFFISSISYKHSITLSNSTDWVVHTYQVHLQLEQLISYLKDAETGHRGYLITHDSLFLRPYKGSWIKINETYHSLQELIKDNPLQQKHLDSIYHFMAVRYSYLSSNLQLDSNIAANHYRIDMNMEVGREIMERIRYEINYMIALENEYLIARQKKYENETIFNPLFTLLLMLFCLVVFAFSYIRINKSLYILKKSNQDLMVATESFKHAEEIGSFGSWQWDLEKKTFTYSDNQYRLFGCEPQSYQPTTENFIGFVHPDDRHLIPSNPLHIKSEDRITLFFFRIIRKDGEVRYIKSISKLLVDASGKELIIGINSDVTDLHQSSQALEEKNEELERTNKELASFNYVASHDLQEPLRKIQTFISIIAEKDGETMTEMTKGYFAKIEKAALRMRVLIDDLLLFSRTNRAEQAFEETNLNGLLENSLQELAQIIEEKKATIQAAQLPTLNVIPFQIQQLFINLIGNALKYKKRDVLPHIQIGYEMVAATSYPFLKAEKHIKYCKITIQDNGMGFDQQQAKNIFILFHRLHHISEYPGTGIGLSICKKIVENHGGFIIAESTSGVGAIFTIFLPLV